MCQEFDVINSAIQMVCKDRTKIISVPEWNGSRIQPFPPPERSDIDEALLKWF
jgi:hypothetical protein